MVAQNGVVGKGFFPDAPGPLTRASLGEATDKATSLLAGHASNLLFIKGIDYPLTTSFSCGHAEPLAQTLTGVAPGITGNTAYSGGPSVDTLMAKALGAGDPFALYAGTKGYIAERISFKAGGAGQTRAADTNPYLLYAKVVGLAQTGAGGVTTMDPAAAELAATRKSVNDLVREELKSLLASPGLSVADRQRLQQHFDAIRDVELKMEAMSSAPLTCTTAGLPIDSYEAFASGFAFKGSMMEDVVKLHLQIVALAFACNYHRVGTLQWGDGTDGTKYDVTSNASLGWTFHQLSHRIQSDSAKGNNPVAEMAHHEIDVVRMQSLAFGLDAFKAHGLENNALIVWTNSISDGPTHSAKDVPMIIWGNGGGKIKQGAFIDAGGTKNGKILNTLMATGLSDLPTAPPTVADGGTFAAMMA
jgi:hypothetical protein